MARPALPRRDYQTLDAIVVVGAMLIVGGGIAGLMFLTVPGENLAVVAGLLGGLSGTVVGGYVGFRFGASLTGKEPQPVRVTNTPEDPAQVEEARP
jgi:hypothetical protein